MLLEVLSYPGKNESEIINDFKDNRWWPIKNQLPISCKPYRLPKISCEQERPVGICVWLNIKKSRDSKNLGINVPIFLPWIPKE